jgi:hypothetical protein
VKFLLPILALIPSEPPAFYEISAPPLPTITVPGDAVSHTLTGLIPGQTYTVTVTAINAAGVRSQPSAGIIYSVPVQPSAGIVYGVPVQPSAGITYTVPPVPSVRVAEIQTSDDLSQWTTITYIPLSGPAKFVRARITEIIPDPEIHEP